MFSFHHRRMQRGFTLIELSVTTAIASILVATAVPSFSALLNRQQLSIAVSDLNLALQLARNEAIATGARTVVAPLAGNDWSTGWQVFRDRNDNGARDAADDVIRVFPAPPASISFASRSVGVNGPFSLDDTGFVRRPGGNGLLMGRFVVTQYGESRTLCFSATRVRTVNGPTC